LDYSFDEAAVRRRIGRAVALIGDEDPIVHSPPPITAKRLNERLGCTVQICAGRGHFNAPEQPDVLGAVEALLAA
jgi:hypothetical protein